MKWPRVPLEEVADWSSGGTPSRSREGYFGPGVPWLSIADLTDGPVDSAAESLTPLGMKNSSAKLLPAGTILVAMYGSIGKLGMTQRPMATSQAIAAARPNLSRLEGSYLFHFLRWMRPQLQAMGRGGTQMNIGQGDLKRITIPLPPLDEQRRIAAILDRADDLMVPAQTSRELLAKLASQLIDDVARQAHPRVAVGDICLVKGGKRTPKESLYSSQVTAHPYLRVSDMRAGGFDTTAMQYLTPEIASRISRYTVDAGDIVVSIAGSIGLVSEVPQSLAGANLTENAAKLVPREEGAYLPTYLAAVLRSDGLQAQIASRTGQVTIGKLALFRIEMLEVPLPPLPVQLGVVANLRSIEGQLNGVETRLSTLSALRNSLQTRAFNGEL